MWRKSKEETGARALPALPSWEGCWAHLPGPGRNLLSSCIQLHTPPGEYMDFFSRGKHFAMLPSFSNHCALVLSLLLKEWAAGMFRGLWTQLMNGLRGRQIKSFWVWKFQFNHVFYLVLKQQYFIFPASSALSGFDSVPSPLSSSVTPPWHRSGQEGGTAGHTSPNQTQNQHTPSAQVQEELRSAPYPFINPDCSYSSMSGALQMCEIMPQTFYLLSFILV